MALGMAAARGVPAAACRDMKVTESSESVLAGTKRPPFRLVCRLLGPDGGRVRGVQPAVSEEFVVRALPSHAKLGPPCQIRPRRRACARRAARRLRGVCGALHAFSPPAALSEFCAGSIFPHLPEN
jgi:hypothetical protein